MYHGAMPRFRLYPDPVQEQQFLSHCGHARYVWNLAVEQLGYRAKAQIARWERMGLLLDRLPAVPGGTVER